MQAQLWSVLFLSYIQYLLPSLVRSQIVGFFGVMTVVTLNVKSHSAQGA